ncbi:unnamed protein product [Microthlaspi erraticum]|uniref:Coenzyme PQQ synthesis protein F-like C-terminal lobe domain-containing protein n=1 Tax=Microthlaspi erraticum TaxID=1685480 RepID=A0A6D2LG06_9BRAS|nr:unnamed protein product [Microthlaspi erraticum]
MTREVEELVGEMIEPQHMSPLAFKTLFSRPFLQDRDCNKTEEGLGYNVECMADFVGGISSFSVTVISSRYNPTFLLHRINQCIDKCRGLLDVDYQTLEEYKRGVRDQLAVETGEDIWNLIEEKRFVRGSEFLIWNEVESIKLEVLMEFHKKFFTESSPECRKAVVCIY